MRQADPPIAPEQLTALQQELGGLLRAEGKLVERLDEDMGQRLRESDLWRVKAAEERDMFISSTVTRDGCPAARGIPAGPTPPPTRK